MKKLSMLSARASSAAAELVDCNGCTACCESGLVYVTEDERARLTKLGVPLVSIDGVSFIKRLPDGSCPMLDKLGKRCSIYENRPLCCRLFPLDVLAISGRLSWVLSSRCPDDRKMFGRETLDGSTLGPLSIGRLASSMEACFSEADSAFFRAKERVAAHVELFEDDRDSWTVLGTCNADGSREDRESHGQKERARKAGIAESETRAEETS